MGNSEEFPTLLVHMYIPFSFGVGFGWHVRRQKHSAAVDIRREIGAA